MRPDKKTCGRLIREIGECVSSPVAIFDLEGTLLDYTDSDQLPEMLNTQRMAFSSQNREETLRACGMIYAPLADDEGNEVCFLLMREEGEPDALAWIETLAKLCFSNQLLSYQQYTDSNDRISFVYQILSSDAQEKELINNRGLKLKIDPYIPRCAFVFMLSDPKEDNEQTTHDDIRKWLLQVLEEAPGSGEQDLGDFLTNREYVLFKALPSADSMSRRSSATRFLTRIEKEAEEQTHCQVRIGIGTVYQELSDMRKSYREAQYVLRNMAVLEAGQTFGFAEDYAFDYLYSLLPEGYQHKRLDGLLHTMKSAAFLPETLKALVVQNCNLVRCAKQLGIHRNTMLQRYERLQETTGLDPVHRSEDKLIVRRCAMYLSRKTVLHTGIIIQNNSDLHRGSRHFASLIEEKSGGTMQVEVLNIGISGNNDALLDLLLCNTLDFVVIDIDALIPYIGREISACNLPHVFESYDDAYRLLTGEFGKGLLSGCEAADMIGLAFWTMGWRYLSSASVPIRVPGQIGGMRVRTMNKEVMKRYITSLNGIPVPLSYDNILPAISENLVESQENPYVNFEDMQLYRKHKCILEENSFFSTNAMVSSQALRKRLSSGQWRIILDAAEETTCWQWKRARQHNEVCRQSLEERRGVQIYRPTPEEQREWIRRADEFRAGFEEHEVLIRMVSARKEWAHGTSKQADL